MSAGNGAMARLPTDIPYRLTRTGEAPISRTYWFTATFTSGSQSINGLFIARLIKDNIPYIRIYEKIWFIWNGCWCSFDYETAGSDVHYFLLEYIQN